MADRLYRALLHCFPPAWRAEFGDAMADDFRQARAEAARHPVVLAHLWIRAVVDAVVHGLRERLRSRISVTATTEGPEMKRRWNKPELLPDLRLAVRRLIAARGFAAVAIVTIALGIGANVAIFTVVNGVLWSPLPFPESSRLVAEFQVWEGKNDVFSPQNFLDVQKRTQTLSSSAAYNSHRFVLTGAGDPLTVIGAEVTTGFFETLGVAPMAGRTFAADANQTGKTGQVVLGHALWRDRFGGDRAAIGKVATFDGKPLEIIGIMPLDFQWPLDSAFWVPVEYDNVFTTSSRGAWYLDTIGRLKPGVSLALAAAEFAGLGQQLAQEWPKANTNVGMTVTPLLDSIVGRSRRALLMLLGAVGLVLLIACVNVANLLLARAASREHELVVRLALGASRWRLVRQVLVESLVLAAAGGLAALMLAFGGVRALVAARPAGIARLDQLAIDGRVLLFTCAATLATGLFFGALPAATVARRTLRDRLSERGRSGTEGRRAHRVRQTLVVSELAFALMLLCGAGLLVKSFVKLVHVDPGFTVGHAATFTINLPDARYAEDEKRMTFYNDFRDRLAHLPGVTNVGAVLFVPPTEPSFNLSFEVRGRAPLPPGQDQTLEVRVADARYFQTMGIPIVRGRGFSASDTAASPVVALLSESAAREYFRGEEAIGKHIDLGWRRNKQKVEGDVVGIVRDVKAFGLDRASPPQIYMLLDQVPVQTMAFVVRTNGDEHALLAPIRQTLAALDKNLPANRLESLAERLSRSLAERRFYLTLLAIFASIAVVLSAVGIFGVLSYLVSQRTREYGIRVALGARRGAVVSLVLKQAAVLAAIGIAIGGLGAYGLSGTIQALLVDVPSNDLWTFCAAAAAMLVVALAAAWIPARKAVSVNPVTALRAD